MKVLYLDCSSGISGDMTLGALVDAGADPEALIAEVGRLGLPGIVLDFEQVVRGGIAGTRAHVRTGETSVHRRLPDVEAVVQASTLPERVRDRVVAVFRRLAAAEAAVHGIPVDEVHFHEVGALDAIVDVVGSVCGLELLGVERIYASELHFGRGTVLCAHGTLPVPVPAVVRLAEGFPVRFTGIEGELTTPTGAALVTTLAHAVGVEVSLIPGGVGHGFGAREAPGRPNALRAILGSRAGPGEAEEVLVVETDVDDIDGQMAAFAMERCLAAGALDVSTTAIQMKKGRPGLRLSVLCIPGGLEAIRSVLQAETGTLGVRVARCARLVAERAGERHATTFGAVAAKRSRPPGGPERLSVEYDDLARIARETGLPLRAVRAAIEDEIARSAGRSRTGPAGPGEVEEPRRGDDERGPDTGTRGGTRP